MTSAMFATRALRTAPRPEKIRGTLLDLVGVQNASPGSLYVDQAGLYVSLNCIDTHTVTALCPDPPDSKTFEGPATIDGIRIAMYSGLTCRGLADWDDLGGQLEHVVAAKESQAVEHGLMEERFTGAAGGDAAIDLTPAGGAVSPKVGLAILEGALGAAYAGVGIIHSPRTIASLLDTMGILTWTGDTIKTGLGTDFVAGAGYEDSVGPDGTPPADGETWMWATGRVEVTAGAIVHPERQLNRSTNDMIELIERVYIADVDCYVAGVRVTIA